MTPERWQQVKDVFERTIEREPAERRAFVDDACAGDDELRDEVTSLLDQHERIGGFSVDTPTGAPGRGATSAPDLSALDTEPLPEAPTPAKVCPRCKAKFDASAAVCPQQSQSSADAVRQVESERISSTVKPLSSSPRMARTRSTEVPSNSR